MKDDVNPSNPALEAANAAPRCRAHSKRTGLPCQAPAVTGWTVCRVHGAGGGHKAGPSHPSWKHGMRLRLWVGERKETAQILREARRLAALID